MKFSEVLCNASADDSFERKVWCLMQPYLLEIAKDRHSNGCHVLFENFSMESIGPLKEIIENEGIAFSYAENDGTKLFCRQIVWNISGFWRGMCHCYRKISDKVLKIKKNEGGKISISIEKIDEKELLELKKYNTYIS